MLFLYKMNPFTPYEPPPVYLSSFNAPTSTHSVSVRRVPPPVMPVLQSNVDQVKLLQEREQLAKIFRAFFVKK
jgi:hypothetical protein